MNNQKNASLQERQPSIPATLPRTITKLQYAAPYSPKKKRVAAYARVSRDYESQGRSLSAQVSYYNKLIQENPRWEFAGVYVDDGRSGTNIEGRDAFQDLVDDCEKGKIDIILTKSISRFARNTIDLLNTVRHLKDLQVEVRFERENIASRSDDGELLLTLLASLAQEESRSNSDNIRWAVQKSYKQGVGLRYRAYGYTRDESSHAIVKEEAKVVRRIYSDYLAGQSYLKIANALNAEGILHYGKPFSDVAIGYILQNERYIGDLMLQKTVSVDFMNRKRKLNEGELPRYYVQNHHEAIISRDTFNAVAAEIKRRRKLGPFANPNLTRRCFTEKIKCKKCGCNYIRTYKTPTNANWRCASNRKHGIKGCRSIGINEEQLKKLSAHVMGTDSFEEDAFNTQVVRVIGHGDGNFTFHFIDGRKITQFWDSKRNAYRDWLKKKNTTGGMN